MNEDLFSWNNLLFGIYPYVCLSVFVIGSWIRFDREQYGWTSASSQLLSTAGMRWASNLFHIGVIGIFFGHLVGLLTPHSVFLMVIGVLEQQYLAMIMGSAFGAMALIGGGMLWLRRFTNPRISVTSRTSDMFILSWVMVTLILGLATIPSPSAMPAMVTRV